MAEKVDYYMPVPEPTWFEQKATKRTKINLRFLRYLLFNAVGSLFNLPSGPVSSKNSRLEGSSLWRRQWKSG
jgi:hypothetical protein